MPNANPVLVKSYRNAKLPPSSPPLILRIIVTIILMILIFGISIAISLYAKEANTPDPANFEECELAKGSVIQESYPPVCVTRKGTRFTKGLLPGEVIIPEPTNGSQNPTTCGGIMGTVCPSGYSCNYDSNYPDASGNCVPN